MLANKQDGWPLVQALMYAGLTVHAQLSVMGGPSRSHTLQRLCLLSARTLKVPTHAARRSSMRVTSSPAVIALRSDLEGTVDDLRRGRLRKRRVGFARPTTRLGGPAASVGCRSRRRRAARTRTVLRHEIRRDPGFAWKRFVEWEHARRCCQMSPTRCGGRCAFARRP